MYPSDECLKMHYNSDNALTSSRLQAQQNLASLALVSTFFSPHALDALWSVLTDIEPLFMVLPSYRDETRSPDSPVCASYG